MNIEQCESMTIGEVNQLIYQLDEAIKLHATRAVNDWGCEDFSEAQSHISSQLDKFLAIKEVLIVYNQFAVLNTEVFTVKRKKLKEAFHISEKFIAGVKVRVESDSIIGTTYRTSGKPTHFISEITEEECTLKVIKWLNT